MQGMWTTQSVQTNNEIELASVTHLSLLLVIGLMNQCQFHLCLCKKALRACVLKLCLFFQHHCQWQCFDVKNAVSCLSHCTSATNLALLLLQAKSQPSWLSQHHSSMSASKGHDMKTKMSNPSSRFWKNKPHVDKLINLEPCQKLLTDFVKNFINCFWHIVLFAGLLAVKNCDSFDELIHNHS